MKTLFVTALVLLSICLSAPVQAQGDNLVLKVENCRIVVLAAELLNEKSEAAISSESASLVLRGLTRSCGYMNGKLRQEIAQAQIRGEITAETAKEFLKVISAGELSGPRYQGILRRARASK